MLLQLGISVYDVVAVLGTTEDVILRTMGTTRMITCAKSRNRVLASNLAHETPMKYVNKQGKFFGGNACKPTH